MPTETRRRRSALAAENARWPRELMEIPVNLWPASVRLAPRPPVRVLRSRTHFVQVFDEHARAPGLARITVNRTEIAPGGRWADGLTFDDLHRLKAEAGYADRLAVEVYPPEGLLVDHSAMRHLWLLPESDPLPPYLWR